MSDAYLKKAAKQNKFLTVVKNLDIDSALPLTAEDIKKDGIVFDGTASNPPPLVSPPDDVSNFNILSPTFFECIFDPFTMIIFSQRVGIAFLF
jgi:hypothetical protein